MLIDADGHRVGARLALAAGVSRQVANGYLQAMVRDGLISAEGTTRARVYALRPLQQAGRRYPREGLQEDVVWRELVAPVVAACPDNVRNIWHFAATEMINNAIDHSGSAEVAVEVMRNTLWTRVRVTDEGEGIFVKIQRSLGLLDARESILELAKGKLTTAPSHHSGEGIFFTSRALDGFEIESHQLRFSHRPPAPDTIAEQPQDAPGTRICMQLANDSPRVMREIFDAYTDPEEFTFDRTVVPLRLAQYEGEELVSRSQAKRVANRFERFKRVELDFSGIHDIGQAFADELFRVFANAHPEIVITALHAEPAVAGMIRRAVAARGGQAITA